ncbi:hypothetical protein [Rhodopseudomonas palustris]|uniref:Uncharacterized protein n=1 Tax=Rhodopseudomonas palustris (strain BisB18) TaxID=316056 RepID=Q212I2_RHOPB
MVEQLQDRVQVCLIVVLLAVVNIGSVWFAAHSMTAIDEDRDDLVKRVDGSTALVNRASRYVERYVSSAFQMAAEVTEGNAVKFVAEIASSRKNDDAMIPGTEVGKFLDSVRAA